MNKWINVKNKLPENLKDVLVVVMFNDNRIIDIGYYSAESKVFDVYGIAYDYENDINVTHWMPLPELPETKE